MDTLDRLLLTLLDTPCDPLLLAMIGDHLEGADGPVHPAGAWWRKDITYGLDRGRLVVPVGKYGIEGWASQGDEVAHPGIADLCERLDRLAAR